MADRAGWFKGKRFGDAGIHKKSSFGLVNWCYRARNLNVSKHIQETIYYILASILKLK
jgi:hypothetical protein